MKLIKFISVLFFASIFVFSVKGVEASERNGNHLDPLFPFVCKKVLPPPKISGELKKKEFLGSWPKKLKVEGEQKNLVVLVSFADQAIDRDVSEEVKKAEEAMFTGENSVNEYYQEVSGGRLRLTGEVLDGLRILPKTFEGYGGSLSNLHYTEILEDTIATVDNDIYFPDYDRIIIIIFMKEKAWLGTKGTIGKWPLVKSDDGDLLISACWIMEGYKDMQYIWRHEIGHTFGMNHAGSLLLKDDEDVCGRMCSIQEIEDDPYGYFEECTTREYWGYDLMGEENCHISSYYKYGLGWLDESEVLIVNESLSVALSPRSAPSSSGRIKTILIKGRNTDGSPKTYFLEYYKKLGNFDDGNDGEETFQVKEEDSKVLLRCFNEYGDDTIEGGEGYIYLEDTFLLIEKEAEEIFNPVNLETVFCDLENGIQIELVGESGKGENSTAEIKITLSCAGDRKPSLSIYSDFSDSVSPDYLQAEQGENIMSEISVVNNMAVGCGTRTFNIEADLPDATWLVTFSPNSTIEVAPCSTSAVTALVEIPESASVGFYNITFRARDNETNLEGENTLSVEVSSYTPTIELTVAINGVDAAMNNIVVARKSWVEVKVKVNNSKGESLQVDKMSCSLIKSDGLRVFRVKKNTGQTSFRFRIKGKYPVGSYEILLWVHKDGYQSASVAYNIEVK